MTVRCQQATCAQEKVCSDCRERIPHPQHLPFCTSTQASAEMESSAVGLTQQLLAAHKKSILPRHAQQERRRDTCKWRAQPLTPFQRSQLTAGASEASLPRPPSLLSTSRQSFLQCPVVASRSSGVMRQCLFPPHMTTPCAPMARIGSTHQRSAMHCLR